jgi:hypothetical protein
MHVTVGTEQSSVDIADEDARGQFAELVATGAAPSG